MQFDEFERMQDELFAQLKQINKTKGIEYRATDDQLSTFKSIGEMLGIPPETVLLVLACKHWQSVITYNRDLIANIDRERSEPMQGRFLDIVQYMMLMEALRRDRECEFQKVGTDQSETLGRRRVSVADVRSL